MAPPYFVRKIDRLNHWELPGTPPNDRPSKIVDKVFRRDDGTVSVFRVSSSLDLVRVAVALNANRKNRPEEIVLVAIAPSELGQIRAVPSPAHTMCR